jgi:hypothetical protein
MVASSASAALEAHSAREQLDGLSKNAAPAVKEGIEKVDKELSVLLTGVPRPAGGEEQPGLDGVSAELGALYEQIGMADAAPTAAQLKAADHAGEEWSEVLKHWERTKGSSIPALNRQLEAAHLPLLNLETQPQTMPDGGDED